ncbi:MAG: hypothetical protein IT373_17810 [Polyangiaceae bacterium]|nr:hypothetical protein [Polyangiaceae bacterium]
MRALETKETPRRRGAPWLGLATALAGVAWSAVASAQPAPAPSAEPPSPPPEAVPEDADENEPTGAEPAAGAPAGEGVEHVVARDGDDASTDEEGTDDEDEVPTLELKYGAKVQTDIRFRMEEMQTGGYYNRLVLKKGVERNLNLVGGKLEVKYGKVSAVVDMDLALAGYRMELESFRDLGDQAKVDPFWFDVRQAYLQVSDLFVKGLDLRVGQQIIAWGVGDQFNPTNNLNSPNIEDPLLFGRQLGNVMVRLDYWFTPEWSHSLVVVPLFKPAILPSSAYLGLTAVDRLPFEDAALRWRVGAEQAAAAGKVLGHPTIVGSATPVAPEPAFDNIQVGYRLAGTVLGQDVALSYYYGRSPVPLPYANHTHEDPTPTCNPDDPTQCTQGLLVTDVSLTYPRMHVYGLNIAGEIPLGDEAKALGYRFEGALVVPQRSTLKITQDALPLALPQPAGEYDYDDDGRPGGPEPVVVDSTPFLKWTLGLDYGIGDHLFINLQWVHGFVDEFGAGDALGMSDKEAVRESGVLSDPVTTLFDCALNRDGTHCAREVLRPRIADYLVLGVDVHMFQQHGLLRLFTIWDLDGYTEEFWNPLASGGEGERVRVHHSLFSKEGFSAVLFPQFSYNFGNGLELAAGALLQLGGSTCHATDEEIAANDDECPAVLRTANYTKFGDPANGGSVFFTRGSFNF